MKRLIRWTVLVFTLLLVLLALYCGLNRDETLPAESSGASLGLMLLERESGLYVLAVTQGSQAEKAGVRPGDYLVASEDVAIGALTGLEQLLEAGADSLPLTLRRDGRQLDILLPVR